MSFQPNNPLFDTPTQSYFANLLYYKSWNPTTWDFNMGWIQSWKALMNGDLFGKSIPTADPTGKFHTLIKKRQAVQGVVKTNTLNADGTLTQTFYDSTYASFRVEQKVTDDLMYEGYIVGASPGTITIKVLNNPTVFVAATHFKVNSTVTARGKLAGLYGSVGTTSIYETKDEQEDYLEPTRDSQTVDMLEKTYYYAGEVGGEKQVYGYKISEADMVNRFLMYVMFKKFFGKGGTNMSGLEGQINKTYGIRNRLIDSSGNYFAGSSQITYNQFVQQLYACRDANPNAQQNILILPGNRALGQLATFFPTQLGFAGGKNEGSTLSITLDVRTVNLAGMNVDVAMNWEMLNDSVNLPDWMKDSIYFINRAQTVIDGTKRSLISPIHFSQNPSGEYRPLYRCIPGMVGIEDGDNTGLASVMNNYQLTASSVSGASCEAFDLSGVSMIPYGHGLFEYPH